MGWARTRSISPVATSGWGASAWVDAGNAGAVMTGSLLAAVSLALLALLAESAADVLAWAVSASSAFTRSAAASSAATRSASAACLAKVSAC